MKEYYNVKDVQTIIGCGQTCAYEVIRKLREKFEKEYKEAVPILGRIPIWYFNEKMGLNGGKANEKSN